MTQLLVFHHPDHLLDFLTSEGDQPGERPGLSALDHGLQCAHELAVAHPCDIELQIAGLVHDIGHRLVAGDDRHHGIHGADAVEALLGPRVANLVALHVPAKRYLVTVEPTYNDTLSAVSIQTLANQGGVMSAGECKLFELSPDRDAALALRRADDNAKRLGRHVPGLDAWARPLHELAGRTCK